MANPNKAKGTAWETETTDFLNTSLGLYKWDWKTEKLPPARRFVDFLSPLNVKRQAQAGNKDVGDLWAWPFIVECKDCKTEAVPSWLRQANVEAENAGFPYGVAVHKTRRAPASHGKVHMSVGTFTRVRLQLGLSARELCDLHSFTVTARGTDTSCWRFSTDLGHFARLLENVRSG